ncbi:MAG: MotB family protein [Pseudomonadota bacterium]
MEEVEQEEGASGAPAWMATFADLATLLLCFFVLLLSFSEMDVAKFKQLAGSMREAFGVQAEIKAKTIPKGTSIIAKEFSPGQPKPTPINTVRQYTIDSSKNSLKVADPTELERLRKKIHAEKSALMEALRLKKELAKEIEEGKILVRAEGNRAIVHILERGSFASGRAAVKSDFIPVLKKIAGLISDSGDTIRVSGHTDNVPISTTRFRSNWELSASRAVSVAHELMVDKLIDESRFIINGHADTRPLAPNDSFENRAKNRRVDIALIKGESELVAVPISVNEIVEENDDE